MKVVKQWVKEDSDYIREKVIEYNQKYLSNEEIVGGITAITFWHHVHVDFLWVSNKAY
jgi:hypothetical protein